MLPEESEPIISVSEFVALLNQALDYTFPSVTISGELANLRISKGKWVYFDLKDDNATVKFFGTVYHLPGPLEDGMLLKVRGQPRLHNQYGFSVNVQTIQPMGEGAIRRAADLLKAKLAAEGLFDEDRKRALPYPPQRIGLITSAQSAAYADFLKILSARWRGLSIELIDVQVQGEIALPQIVSALEQFNAQAAPPEVLVLIRGGGSAEDMAVWNSEAITRAIAASRIPTLVAIGHEIDVCLAELAADCRASTPSNAAELLVPDQAQSKVALEVCLQQLQRTMAAQLRDARQLLVRTEQQHHDAIQTYLHSQQESINGHLQLLVAYNPGAILRRGYAIVRQGIKTIRHGSDLTQDAIVHVQLIDAHFEAKVQHISIENP